MLLGVSCGPIFCTGGYLMDVAVNSQTRNTVRSNSEWWTLVYSAIVNNDLAKLKEYKQQGANFNVLDTYSYADGTLLQIAIWKNNPQVFDALVSYGVNVNNTSPSDHSSALHYAVASGSQYFTQKLIDLGANVNIRDNEGRTPLFNAFYYEEPAVAQILLKNPYIDVNIPSIAGHPPILYAYLIEQNEIIDKIISHPSYDPTFNRVLLSTYNFPKLDNYLVNHGKSGDENVINAYKGFKLFGLKYDLDGCMPLTKLQTHQLECLDHAGYFNDLGAAAMVDSYNQFYSKVIAESMIPTWANQAFVNVQESLNFSATVFDPKAYYDKIMRGELVIVPSGWDGHSISFVFHNDRLYRSNRGEHSDEIHGIDEFIITKPANLTVGLIDFMLQGQGDSTPLQFELIEILGLQKIGMVENPTQIAGNCVWTSLETAVEAAFISSFKNLNIDDYSSHTYAKQSFLIWEEYDLTYTLKEVIDHKQTYIAADVYDDMLIRALETHHDPKNEHEIQRGVLALNELSNKAVSDTFYNYIGYWVQKYDPYNTYGISYMKPYASHYSYSNWQMTPEQKKYAKEYLDFLKACDDYQKTLTSQSININDVLGDSIIDGFDSIFPRTLPTPIKEPSLFVPNTPLVPEIIPQNLFAQSNEHFM